MSKRYTELDSIRGLASLSVLFHHCLLCFNIFLAAHFHNDSKNEFVNIISNSPLHIFWAGHESVILFFILSGFVLSLPYINNKKQHYPTYIIKRIIRIYFPYIITIFISGLFFTILNPKGNYSELSDWFNQMWSNPITPFTIISYLLMLGFDTHNLNTVSWSLVHEMRISFFFPLIMILITRFKRNITLLFGLIGIYCLWITFSFLGWHISNSKIAFLIISLSNTFYYTSFFIAGAVLAKYKEFLILKLKSLTFYFKLMILLIALLLYTIEWNIPGLGILKYTSTKIQLLGINLVIDWFITIGVLILFIFALSSTKFKNLLKMRFLLHIGKISYSLYLIHPIILLLFIYLIRDTLPLSSILVFVPIISVLVAHLMYKFIENPSILLGKKIVNNLNKLLKI
ncbi:acyltransferase family protein [Bacillus thuringiensis]|uniref:acyltransferase family protein n=1 Tax=Bacillus thuringiensis TaxID=1428 RepID=UPI0015964969|nr:acyltransferase [Bacillus thuringiensis]